MITSRTELAPELQQSLREMSALLYAAAGADEAAARSAASLADVYLIALDPSGPNGERIARWTAFFHALANFLAIKPDGRPVAVAHLRALIRENADLLGPGQDEPEPVPRPETQSSSAAVHEETTTDFELLTNA